MTATSATLSFSQPTNSLSVDMYTVTLTGTTCNGVPTRTGSTTSNSVTIGSLEAGIRYSVAAVGRNNLAELEGTGSAALTTSEAGNNIQSNCGSDMRGEASAPPPNSPNLELSLFYFTHLLHLFYI